MINRILLILTFTFSATAFSQFYNKEIAAKIIVENKGEFLSFTATAENLTPSDQNLRYEFTVFKTDESNNASKSGQGDLFFLKAHERQILSNTTVNNSGEGKVTIVLLIYDLEDKPLGKDRIELKTAHGAVQQVEEKDRIVISQDQAAPQDGVAINGLVIENTITKAGRDFYKYFYSEYYNKQITTAKNIEIEEVPGRGRNTRITVKVGDQIVLQFFAQPRKDYLKKVASAALARSIAYLQQLEKQDNNFKYY